MGNKQELRVSFAFTDDVQDIAPSALDSWVRLIKSSDEINLKNNEALVKAIPNNLETGEVRGFEWVGYLVEIISNGAANAIIQSILACFQSPRLSSGTFKLNNDAMKVSLEISLSLLDKNQMSKALELVEKFMNYCKSN